MDNHIIINEITRLKKDEEAVISFKDRNLILTHPNNKNGAISVHSIRTIGKNSLKINRTKFVDCDFVYYFEKRLIENKRIMESVKNANKER